MSRKEESDISDLADDRKWTQSCDNEDNSDIGHLVERDKVGKGGWEVRDRVCLVTDMSNLRGKVVRDLMSGCLTA